MNIVDKRNFIETFCRRHMKMMRDESPETAPCESCIMHDVHENGRCWLYCSDLIITRNFDVLLSRLESNENEILEIIAEMDEQNEIVRCKDCKYFCKIENLIYFDGKCSFSDCFEHYDDFCSGARRKE